MNGCCDTGICKPQQHLKHRCPENNRLCNSVSVRTVIHHACNPWGLETEGKDFYFCDDPECDVVYFANDDSIITKSQLRTQVGIKTHSIDATLCYCFGLTKSAYMENPGLKDFVARQTRLGLCSCESSNPSGKCCLKDFPK